MFMVIAVVFAGLGGMLFAWMVARPVLRSSALSVAQRAPESWRWRWPWLSGIAGICEGLLSRRQRDYPVRWSRQIGLPIVATPTRLVAWILIAAISGALAGTGAAMVIDTSGALIWGALIGALIAVSWSIARLLSRIRRRRRSIDQDLPFVLDMMTLCVESGLGLYSALQQAERHGPRGYLRQELGHALSDMRAGVPRAAALRTLADRCNCSSVHRWIAALIQADGLGMSIGLLLREHASQCRADRFQRAEKLAMEAPVKMLLPLIACIFPCTFIVLAFPIVIQMWQVAQ